MEFPRFCDADLVSMENKVVIVVLLVLFWITVTLFAQNLSVWSRYVKLDIVWNLKSA